MITINNKKYNLLLLDTNAISGFLKDVKIWLNYIDHHHPKSIICTSIFSLSELSKRKELFEKYLKFFSVWPSGILDSHESIYLKEFESYGKDKSDISPVVLFPSNFTFLKDITPEKAFKKVLELANFESRMSYWLDSREDVLKNILKLIDNYKPTGEKYTIKEIENFIYFGTIQQIIIRNTKFANQTVKVEKKEIDINKFPSLLSTLYVVFYKFYPDNKVPKLSDIIDLIISSVFPYVDFVITEGHLCEIIRKVQSRHQFLTNLNYTSIRDVNKELNKNT